MSGNDRSGTVFDQRYQLTRLIGRGATAEVYAGVDLRNNMQVAVKIFSMDLRNNSEARGRFERESSVQAMVRHRNIAALFASGITARHEPYLVLELLRGTTLRGIVKSQKRVPAFQAASYMWQALQGLAAIHDQGVRHRDLKPANIMLEPSPGPIDRVVLIDFGFASLEGGAALTHTGTVVGSLTYMAPERLRSEGASDRSDLYAIGAILFELLTGKPPFELQNEFDLVDAHLKALPPATIVDGKLSPLDEIIQTALQKDQSLRYDSAHTMARALERIAPSLQP